LWWVKNTGKQGNGNFELRKTRDHNQASRMNKDKVSGERKRNCSKEKKQSSERGSHTIRIFLSFPISSK
jgi:hypothetical protein